MNLQHRTVLLQMIKTDDDCFFDKNIVIQSVDKNKKYYLSLINMKYFNSQL